MKTKIKLSFLILLFATQVYAVEITQMPSVKAGFFQHIFSAIKKCKLNVRCYFEPKLGTSVTEISGSTLISAFPTIHNTNVNNLNDGKIENASSSIAAITTLSNLTETGVLASSTFRGSAVGIPYGGTGSTTLSSNRVLLGSGANSISTVVGFGTPGQTLQSSGSGNAPTWEANTTDENATYHWTGTHDFDGRINFNSSSLINATGTTLIKNLNASSSAANPIYLNGIDYAFPSVEGASSTVITTNGSGTLIWDTPQSMELLATITASGSPIALGATGLPSRAHFQVIFSTTGKTTIDSINMLFNGDNGNNYTRVNFSDYVRISGSNNAAAIGLDVAAGTTTPQFFQI